jgi:ubiquinone/menaquinone biosynthesis C-methylase UbiE
VKATGERRTVSSARSPEDRAQDLFHVFPYHFVKRFCSTDTRVLDVGFGEGYGAAILSESVGDYVGLDMSEDAVRHASSRYTFPNVRFERSDATAIPFDAESFDLVVSFHVLEHVDEPEPYLVELARVCRPEGHVVIVTPNGAFRLAPGERPWNRFHVREFDRGELARLLSKHFTQFAVMGIAGNAEMNGLERARVGRARRFARLDPLGLRYRLPEVLMVRVRRCLTKAARQGRSESIQPGFSLDDVRCAESDVDDSIHLIAVIDRKETDGSDIRRGYRSE